MATPHPRRPRRAPSPRSLSRGSTPQAVLAATEALLLEGGVDAVSIRRVSSRCGYSAPTIYHHFGDKNGLVAAVLERRFRRHLEMMRAVPRGNDAALYLRKMAVEFLRFALANPEHYRLLTVARVDRTPGAVPSAEEGRQMVREALADLLREGTLATQDLESAFLVLWSMIHGLISLHLLSGEKAIADDLVELALDTVERGLLRRTPK